MDSFIARLTDSQFNFLFGIVVLLAVVALGVIIYLIINVHIVFEGIKEAKNATDLESLTKMIQKKLKKEKHSIVFAVDSRDDLDNIREYKDFNKMFGMDREILKLEYNSTEPFDSKLDDYKIVIFKVHDREAQEGPEEVIVNSLYWRLANYCGNNDKNCVLFTGKNRVFLEGLSDFYVTTVNYYSKLRETLYTLLYFTE